AVWIARFGLEHILRAYDDRRRWRATQRRRNVLRDLLVTLVTTAPRECEPPHDEDRKETASRCRDSWLEHSVFSLPFPVGRAGNAASSAGRVQRSRELAASAFAFRHWQPRCRRVAPP